jgi:hypothetical protein
MFFVLDMAANEFHFSLFGQINCFLMILKPNGAGEGDVGKCWTVLHRFFTNIDLILQLAPVP